MNSRYVLKTEDGRMVTNDARTGPTLTMNQALCYVWQTPETAESERLGYQAVLGVVLTVEPQEPGALFCS